MSRDIMQATRAQVSTEVAQETLLIRLLCAILPFSVMNVLMFNVALPDIASTFALNPSAASWVVTVFSIIYALGSLIYAKLADLYALKSLVTFGILSFAFGSILGFAAPEFGGLLAGRIVQAVGASSLPALAMLIPARYVAAERRGRALGIVVATLALSAGVAPIVGGLISGTFHWRYLFLMPLGTLLAIPLFWKWLPTEERGKGESVDLWGAGMLGGAVTCLMLAITEFHAWLLLASLSLLVIFVVRQKRAESPFIPLALFRNDRYRPGLLIGSLSSSTNVGVTLITPLLLNQAYGLNASWIGLIMFPGTMSAALLSRYGGQLADQNGNRFMMVRAVTLLAFGLFSLSTFAGHAVWAISISLIPVNVGASFMQATLANWVSMSLPRERTGVGMGVYNLTNFLSMAVSGALVTKALEFAVPLHPLALSGDAARYSSIYLGLLLLTLLNMRLVFKRVYDLKRRDHTGSLS